MAEYNLFAHPRARAKLPESQHWRRVMTWLGILASTLAFASAARGALPSHAHRVEAVRLGRGDSTLFGTLEIPVGYKRTPLAIFLSGSGPTNRDGNTPSAGIQSNCLKLLARALEAQGVSTLRYDKRGVGESANAAVSESTLSVTTYSEDARGWISRYRGDPRFSAIVLVGHSEGALIGTLAAERAPVDGLVLLAAAGRPISQVLREQLGRQLTPDLMARSDSILAQLARGLSVDEVPSDLWSLYRPSVQPYLRSWLPLDPADELKRVSAPVMVVQGTTDAQVSLEDVNRLVAARPDAVKLVIRDMNHVLKIASADLDSQRRAYVDSTLALAPGLAARVTDFVLGMKEKK